LLRINVERESLSATFRIAGSLAGPWVNELRQAWQAEYGGQKDKYFQVDLSEVISVDPAGKELLMQMYEEGADLIAITVEIRSIVDEITRNRRVPRKK
jgi:ABC-type transporter Mla MlaB component